MIWWHWTDPWTCALSALGGVTLLMLLLALGRRRTLHWGICLLAMMLVLAALVSLRGARLRPVPGAPWFDPQISVRIRPGLEGALPAPPVVGPAIGEVQPRATEERSHSSRRMAAVTQRAVKETQYPTKEFERQIERLIGVAHAEAARQRRGDAVCVETGAGALVFGERRTGSSSRWAGRWMWSLMTAAALTAFLYLGYLFLDAGTRGQFTWPLRIFSLVAFAGILLAVVALRASL